MMADQSTLAQLAQSSSRPSEQARAVTNGSSRRICSQWLALQSVENGYLEGIGYED
jgi:hypothetical protein